MSSDFETPRLTRRRFNQAVGAGLASGAGPGLMSFAQAASAEPRPGAATAMEVTITVNGRPRTVSLDPRTTLLDALREHLGLTGTKKGCDHGQCGACTALVDGRRMNTCLSLAVMHEGSQVVTIEGLGSRNALHPMQAAFIKHDGYQCGYCTPGQVLSAVATLDEIAAGIPSAATADVSQFPSATAAEVRERMSGNLCRCAAYPNIVAAVMDVRGTRG
ncbi:Xanthine dehydrogenase iron-sulfur binding subunit [Bordetella sputigena]|uniref:2Fe-2S iron-sulfur cluster-binding protein n=1 Tax=Bordetella sputigena TaxID=1416810 RepID=UPI0039EFDC6E